MPEWPTAQATAWQAFGPGLDLSGFIPVKTAVTRDGGREWLELENDGERIRLTPVPPPTSPPDTCAETSPPVYLGFSTIPRMRLALRAERISLERELGDCWVDVTPTPEALKRGKPLRRIAPVATPLSMALDKIDRALKGVTLVLTGDEIELTRDGDTLVSEDLAPATIVEDGFDEEGGGTNRREVEVTPLRNEAKRLVALEIVTDEGLTGSGAPIGGAREYARKVRWVVSLDGTTATALLVADVEAPYSGDGYTGSDDGHQEIWRRAFEGGVVVGTWSSDTGYHGAPAAHIPTWRVASPDDLVQFDVSFPRLDRELRSAKKLPAAPSITEVVSSDLSFSVEPMGLTITARGERTTIPLWTQPVEGAQVAATYTCTVMVCHIAAHAVLPAPDGEDEYGHPLTGASRSASVIVSRTTLQVHRR